MNNRVALMTIGSLLIVVSVILIVVYITVIMFFGDDLSDDTRTSFGGMAGFSIIGFYIGYRIVKRETNINKGINFEKAMRYDDAIKIYQHFHLRKDVLRCQRKELENAELFEKSGNYRYAIPIYDKHEKWEKAGQCRKSQMQSRLKPTYKSKTEIKVENIDQSININDSVIMRSNITSTIEGVLKRCPLCNENLNFPKIPKYCPYCDKMIAHLVSSKRTEVKPIKEQ